jgi:hypothetical protein
MEVVMIPRRSWSPGLLGLSLLAVPSVSCSDTGPDTVRVDATVEFLQVEGGCWSLLADDGVRYEPTNLANEFRQDCLAVETTHEPQDDRGSTCQVGEIVAVLSIQRRN